MKKFILTSPKFTGEVIFGYNETDRLVYYENTSAMTEQQLDWLLGHLPHASSWINSIIKNANGTRIVEVPEDLTFERFWNSYDKKINRKRAEPLFEKLNDAAKMQAIVRIKTYQEYCHYKGRGIADPEKYIRDRFFETDWNKVK